MRILHISPYALRGGCEKNCYLFIQNSPQLAHSVVVLGLEGPMSKEWSNIAIKVDHLNILSKSIFGFKRQIENHFKEESYDMIIYWSTVRISSILGSFLKNSKSFRIYLGNPSSYTNLQLFKEFLLGIYWKKPKNIKLMACSKYVAESFRNLNFFRDFKMEVSYNPVKVLDVNPYHPKKNLHSEFNLGMVARLDPIKNHSLLIDAFSKVIEKFPNMKLHLVGDGILKSELQEKVNVLKLNNMVIFHGDVGNVYQFLQSWDAFIYSTTEKEGLGSAVIEAMANGLPCILPDLAMIKELAPNGTDVIWYNAKSESSLIEECLNLLNRMDQFPDMSKSVYNYSLNFTPKRFINDYLSD